MPFLLSPQSIEALAEVVTGGSGTGYSQPIGIYRCVAKLGSFMRNCNVDFQVIADRPSAGDQSRRAPMA